MKTKFTFLLCFVIVVFGFSQTTTLDKKIPVDKLQEDFDILRKNLEVAHPDLYLYTPKEQLDAAFDEIRASIKAPMRSIDFLKTINPLLKLIGNGHTDFVPSTDFFTYFRNEAVLFPFRVYWDEGELYIYRNLSEDKNIPLKTIIKRINGEDTKQLFAELTDYITRDGYNTSLPEATVMNRFYRCYAFYKGFPSTFELDIVEPNGEEKTITVKALQKKVLDSNLKERYGPLKKNFYQSDEPALKLTIDGDIATLTIKTFAADFARKMKKQKFKPFLNDAFQKIEQANVKHLIIDLRDNGGGDPKPTIELFSHLYDKPFTFYKNVYTITKKLPTPEYYENSKLDQFILKIALKKRGDVYVGNVIAKTQGMAGLKPSKPSKTVFGGDVYVLTNPYSFSATGEMSAIIKQYNRATFIGEEAGGNPNQNTSGMMPVMTLPHSKNRVVMSLIAFKMNVDFENTGRGVIPDHIVRRSIDDLLERKDRVMEFTLEKIRASN